MTRWQLTVSTNLAVLCGAKVNTGFASACEAEAKQYHARTHRNVLDVRIAEVRIESCPIEDALRQVTAAVEHASGGEVRVPTGMRYSRELEYFRRHVPVEK